MGVRWGGVYLSLSDRDETTGVFWTLLIGSLMAPGGYPVKRANFLLYILHVLSKRVSCPKFSWTNFKLRFMTQESESCRNFTFFILRFLESQNRNILRFLIIAKAAILRFLRITESHVLRFCDSSFCDSCDS